MNTQVKDTPSTSVLYIGFNQDFGCFSVGTDNGFRIYNCDPFRETFRRDFPNGGIGIVEMLYRCNILALVGGGRTPCFPPTRVMLWDDHQVTPIGELSFRSEVKAVKMRRDSVIVVLDSAVYVYGFEKLEPLNKFDTHFNPKGIVALSPAPNNAVFACPATQKGVARIANLNMMADEQFIMAHESTLSFIALNNDGTRLATASEKGTILRIYETSLQEGQTQLRRLKEVRRGVDNAEIYCINFSSDSRFICVSSDKATIHVFDIGGPDNTSGSDKEGQNRKSSVRFLGGLSSYFSSEWSFAWYKGPDCPCICAFTPDNNYILVVSADGQFYRLNFNPQKGGQLTEADSTVFPTK
eukprot:TRINITY_DN68437_c0_g1_i1.p1 TRINITY_DN68437_c0_g1~~TRINITY_DN68437_c0_g1_i1.p1  ORF type:complete len:354 (-),score=18.08 TRINITY_DN68437_c0_g1_i1:1173-2234(-)